MSSNKIFEIDNTKKIIIIHKRKNGLRLFISQNAKNEAIINEKKLKE